MITIHVVLPEVGNDGEELWHEFKSELALWEDRPSGVLNIFRRPDDQWASYAPGQWKAVRDASGEV